MDSLDVALDAALAMTFLRAIRSRYSSQIPATEPLLPSQSTVNSTRGKIPLGNKSAHRVKCGEPFGVLRMKRGGVDDARSVVEGSSHALTVAYERTFLRVLKDRH